MQALLWEARPDNSVACRLCAQACRLKPGEKGRCGVRVNVDGAMHTLVGDVVTSVSMDPVGKSPSTIFCGHAHLFRGQRGLQLCLPLLPE
jgi:pyruvate formate lyase activating enzyme